MPPHSAMSNDFLLLVICLLCSISQVVAKSDAEVKPPIKFHEPQYGLKFTIAGEDMAARMAVYLGGIEDSGNNDTVKEPTGFHISRQVLLCGILGCTLGYCACCYYINYLSPSKAGQIKVQYYTDSEVAMRNQGNMGRGQFLTGGRGRQQDESSSCTPQSDTSSGSSRRSKTGRKKSHRK